MHEAIRVRNVVHLVIAEGYEEAVSDELDDALSYEVRVHSGPLVRLRVRSMSS